MGQKIKKICVMCGKEYPFCATATRYQSYRINFCSPECFANYLEACSKKHLNSFADTEENISKIEMVPNEPEEETFLTIEEGTKGSKRRSQKRTKDEQE